VDELYFKSTSEKVHNESHQHNVFINLVKKIIKYIIQSNSYLRKISPKIYFYNNYTNHPHAWFGAFDKKFIDKYYSGKENINSFLALQIIEEKEKQLN